MQTLVLSEMREIQSIYEMSHPNEKISPDIAKVLNVFPEHCFKIESGGETRVQVIDWGQWAMFFQRHLCSVIQQNYYRLDQQLGVPDEAKKYSAESDRAFGGLTLYPFVQRIDCKDEASYRKSTDDAFKVTAATPQFVPAYCWGYLYYSVPFAPKYSPVALSLIVSWFNRNPLPGTVYDLDGRMEFNNLTSGDAVPRFQALRQLAPYDTRISDFLAKNQYNKTPNYDQAMSLYHEMLDYSPSALGAVAKSVYDDPKRYVELMTRAAELDPRWYYALGTYMSGTNALASEEKAAAYFQKAYDVDQDRVRASNQALWLVRYYLSHHQTAKAGEVAKDAGEVYSFGGLEAQAWYFEGISNYDSALEWYSKIEERYDNFYPVLYFCLRYKENTSDHRFDGELQKCVGKLFPDGVEKVSLKDFKDAPADGALIKGDSQLLADAGLKSGDVIVAATGMRVHNLDQYTYARDVDDDPELDLIVWHDGAYKEVKSSVPHHRFGVDLGVYPPPQ